ncbi:MAG: amidohydrolase [Tabrizicola sp.]|nr:amidohydrolase [Tabrizicola sp.]
MHNILTDDEIHAVKANVAERAAEFVAIADVIWDYAELGFAEVKSSKALASALKNHGFAVKWGIGGLPTAFVAERGSGGPTLGILGEFDALAEMSQAAGHTAEEAAEAGGSGYGCGHHLLGTAGALAAIVAADRLKATGTAGTVRYFGCPAEESLGGKAFMARAGAFDGLNAAFSWHPGPRSSGYLNLTRAFRQIRVRFRGVAAHAALAPHLGRSALDAAELMNIGANYLREHIGRDEHIHYAYMDAGGMAANVVQARAELAYIMRSETVADVIALSDRLRKVAEGAAMMTETTVTFEVEAGMSPCRPNLTLARMMHSLLERAGPPDFSAGDHEDAQRFADLRDDGNANAPLHSGIEPLPEDYRASMGSTDVGDVSMIVPMAQVWVASYASGTGFHTWQMVAQGKLGAAHRGMLKAAEVIAASVLASANHPEILAAATVEHRAHFGTAPYTCPIPNDVMPPLPKI